MSKWHFTNYCIMNNSRWGRQLDMWQLYTVYHVIMICLFQLIRWYIHMSIIWDYQATWCWTLVQYSYMLQSISWAGLLVMTFIIIMMVFTMMMTLYYIYHDYDIIPAYNTHCNNCVYIHTSVWIDCWNTGWYHKVCMNTIRAGASSFAVSGQKSGLDYW